MSNALSSSNADELNKKVGDEIVLNVDGFNKKLKETDKVLQEKLDKQKKRDEYKKQYCKDKGIILLEISYL